MLAMIVLGILGNILSLSVWLRRRLRRGRMAKYMSLLAVADMCALITGLFIRVLPEIFSVNVHSTNVFGCYFLYYLLGFFTCISAWILVVMTVERFVVIAMPLTSSDCLSRCKAPTLISVIVIFSGLINVPLILANSWDKKQHCVVNESREDMAKLVIFTLYSPVPILLLLILNLAIISKMNRFSRKIENDPNSSKSISKQSSRRSSNASQNTGPISLVAFYKKSNIFAPTPPSPNMAVNNNTESQSPTKKLQISTVQLRHRKQRPQTIQTAGERNQMRRHSFEVMSSILPAELASISECSTPDEECGLSIVSLPDLVTGSVLSCESLNQNSESEPKADVSLDSRDNSKNILYNNESYLEDEITVAETSNDKNVNINSSASSPDIIISHPIKATKRSKRSTHPPPMSTSGSRLEKHRSSIALFIDQIKDKSEHIAEKYNKIRNKRTAVMLLTVTFSYFLLTTPYMVTIYLLVCLTSTSNHEHENVSQTQSNLYLAQHILELLLCLNHSINVVLYCATGSKFRGEIKRMFICKSRLARRVETISENHSSSGNIQPSTCNS